MRKLGYSFPAKPQYTDPSQHWNFDFKNDELIHGPLDHFYSSGGNSFFKPHQHIVIHTSFKHAIIKLLLFTAYYLTTVIHSSSIFSMSLDDLQRCCPKESQTYPGWFQSVSRKGC